MACVLMEILMIRVLNASTETETTSVNDVVAKPMKNSEAAIIIKPAVIGILLSYRDTSQPEMGSPIKELMGINNRTVPSCASLYAKKVLMVGIRDAHVEKQTPARKKNRLKKNLCLRLSTITFSKVGKIPLVVR